jgi:hypothetical protein
MQFCYGQTGALFCQRDGQKRQFLTTFPTWDCSSQRDYYTALNLENEEKGLDKKYKCNYFDGFRKFLGQRLYSHIYILNYSDEEFKYFKHMGIIDLDESRIEIEALNGDINKFLLAHCDYDVKRGMTNTIRRILANKCLKDFQTTKGVALPLPQRLITETNETTTSNNFDDSDSETDMLEQYFEYADNWSKNWSNDLEGKEEISVDYQPSCYHVKSKRCGKKKKKNQTRMTDLPSEFRTKLFVDEEDTGKSYKYMPDPETSFLDLKKKQKENLRHALSMARHVCENMPIYLGPEDEAIWSEEYYYSKFEMIGTWPENLVFTDKTPALFTNASRVKDFDEADMRMLFMSEMLGSYDEIVLSYSGKSISQTMREFKLWLLKYEIKINMGLENGFIIYCSSADYFPICNMVDQLTQEETDSLLICVIDITGKHSLTSFYTKDLDFKEKLARIDKHDVQFPPNFKVILVVDKEGTEPMITIFELLRIIEKRRYNSMDKADEIMGDIYKIHPFIGHVNFMRRVSLIGIRLRNDLGEFHSDYKKMAGEKKCFGANMSIDFRDFKFELYYAFRDREDESMDGETVLDVMGSIGVNPKTFIKHFLYLKIRNHDFTRSHFLNMHIHAVYCLTNEGNSSQWIYNLLLNNNVMGIMAFGEKGKIVQVNIDGLQQYKENSPLDRKLADLGLRTYAKPGGSAIIPNYAPLYERAYNDVTFSYSYLIRMIEKRFYVLRTLYEFSGFTKYCHRLGPFFVFYEGLYHEAIIDESLKDEDFIYSFATNNVTLSDIGLRYYDFSRVIGARYFGRLSMNELSQRDIEDMEVIKTVEGIPPKKLVLSVSGHLLRQILLLSHYPMRVHHYLIFIVHNFYSKSKNNTSAKFRKLVELRLKDDETFNFFLGFAFGASNMKSVSKKKVYTYRDLVQSHSAYVEKDLWHSKIEWLSAGIASLYLLRLRDNSTLFGMRCVSMNVVRETIHEVIKDIDIDEKKDEQSSILLPLYIIHFLDKNIAGRGLPGCEVGRVFCARH